MLVVSSGAAPAVKSIKNTEVVMVIGISMVFTRGSPGMATITNLSRLHLAGKNHDELMNYTVHVRG